MARLGLRVGLARLDRRYLLALPDEAVHLFLATAAAHGTLTEVLEAAAEKNQQGFVASECPLAAAHIVQGISRLPGSEGLPPARPYHPIEIFALSYGLVRDAR